MIANITSCKTLLSTVRSLGVEPPASLTQMLNAYGLIQRSRARSSIDQDLAALMTSGDLDAAAVDAFFDENAMAYARGQVAREVSEAAERVALLTFQQAMRGEAGEQLTAVLSPIFDEAVRGLERVISVLPPGTTPATAIDAGPEAVQAWGDGPRIDTVMRRFVTYATLVGRDLNLVSRGQHLTHPMSSLVAFFVTEDADLDSAARAFSFNPAEYRAGAFHSLVVAGGAALRLNSPATAQRLCDAQSEQEAERLHEDYERTHSEAVA